MEWRAFARENNLMVVCFYVKIFLFSHFDNLLIELRELTSQFPQEVSFADRRALVFN